MDITVLNLLTSAQVLIEKAILSQPSGDIRNKICDINIKLVELTTEEHGRDMH